MLRDSLGGLFRIGELEEEEEEEEGVGAVLEVTHVEGMLAPLGSGSEGEGAAWRCCMLDRSVGSRGTGSSALYGAPTVSSTCSDHINTH